MTQEKLICLTAISIKKIAYGLFILWIGFLAPLTFFNTFAVSHAVQPYRIALFEKLPQPHRQVPAELVSRQIQRLNDQIISPQASLTNRSLFFSLAQSLLSSLGPLSFFGTTLLLPLVVYRGRLNPGSRLAERSVCLPPPDQPPRRLLLAT